MSTMSSKFQVANGVRQGSVLSPLLFDVYVNELSELLNKSGIDLFHIVRYCFLNNALSLCGAYDCT